VKLSYSNLACPEWPFERCVEAVGEYGYDGLELRLFDGEVITPELSQTARRRATATLARSGFPVAALDTSLQLTLGATETGRARFLADIGQLAALAGEWGAPLLRLFGGPLPAEPAARAATLGAAGALLGAAAPIAERHGVRLAVETHDGFSAAATLAQLLGSAKGLAGAVYDTHHPHRMGESPADVVATLGVNIWHVHVKDARRRTPGRDEWELVALGQGEVPVRSALGELGQAGYDGWVSLEFERKWHPELAPPEQALPAQGALLREWLRAVPAVS